MFFECLKKFEQIRFCHNALNSKFAGESIRYFGLQEAFFQEFNDPRSNVVQTEHLTAMNVEDGCTILTMRNSHIYRYADCLPSQDLRAGWSMP